MLALTQTLCYQLVYESARAREAGWLDKYALEILRCPQRLPLSVAKDDSRGFVILSAAKDLWRT